MTSIRYKLVTIGVRKLSGLPRDEGSWVRAPLVKVHVPQTVSGLLIETFKTEDTCCYRGVHVIEPSLRRSWASCIGLNFPHCDGPGRHASLGVMHRSGFAAGHLHLVKCLYDT